MNPNSDDNQAALSDLEACYSFSRFDPSGNLEGHASLSSDDNESMDISPK